MRVLFTRFPLESALGGAEIQLLSLMKGLKEKSHDVEFLGSCPVLLEGSTKYGVRSMTLDIGPPPVTKWGSISFYWRREAMRRQLIYAIETQGIPDSVFMVSVSEKLLLTEWAHSKGIKVFWIEHDRVGDWLKRNPWLPSLKRAAKHAMIITVSELSRRIFIDLGFDPTRIIAIPNGIDLHRFRKPANRQPSKPVNQLHLGCIARLSEEKGVDLLIRSIADMPEITLSIVGQGRDEGCIRTMIAKREKREGLERIFLSPSADLQEFYASIDALVLPSRDNDPFGLVAAEAMTLGIPVIATDACGIAEYLKNGEDAVIVKANDEKAMTDAIAVLKDAQTRQRIGQAGMKTAREKFSLERMIGRYESLIAKINN